MLALTALDAVFVAVVAAASLLLALIVRRRVLHRGGGTIDLSLRLRPGGHGRGWVLGIGRFAGDELQWYRVFSLSLRPRRSMSRRELTIVSRRAPRGPEVYALLKGAEVMDCSVAGTRVELAMEPGAVTGFLAWLEAQSPGHPLSA